MAARCSDARYQYTKAEAESDSTRTRTGEWEEVEVGSRLIEDGWRSRRRISVLLHTAVSAIMPRQVVWESDKVTRSDRFHFLPWPWPWPFLPCEISSSPILPLLHQPPHQHHPPSQSTLILHPNPYSVHTHCKQVSTPPLYPGHQGLLHLHLSLSIPRSDTVTQLILAAFNISDIYLLQRKIQTCIAKPSGPTPDWSLAPSAECSVLGSWLSIDGPWARIRLLRLVSRRISG